MKLKFKIKNKVTVAYLMFEEFSALSSVFKISFKNIYILCLQFLFSGVNIYFIIQTGNLWGQKRTWIIIIPGQINRYSDSFRDSRTLSSSHCFLNPLQSGFIPTASKVPLVKDHVTKYNHQFLVLILPDVPQCLVQPPCFSLILCLLDFKNTTSFFLLPPT